jgi:hypothetical protein
MSSLIDIAKSLIRFTYMRQAFQQPPEVETTFQEPKEALCTVPSPSYPQAQEKFTVETEVK